MVTVASQNRIHALDNLRALLALFGIPFHVTLFLSVNEFTSYDTFDLNAQLLSAVFPHNCLFIFSFFIHIFRMPMFFLLAGFFAHLLYERAGIFHFFKNRSVRIAIPFIFFMVWLGLTYIEYVASLAMQAMAQQPSVFSVSFLHILTAQYHSGVAWGFMNNTRDAWFLYDLLWLYCFTLMLLGFKKHILHKEQIRKKLDAFLQRLFKSYRLYVILSLLCALLLYPSGKWYIMLDTRLIPSFSLLLFYSLWYFLGWWLWLHKSLIESLSARVWYHMAAALGLYVLFLSVDFYVKGAETFQPLGICLYSFIMVFLVFALLGMAWRYLYRYQGFFKYMSEASYWIYISQWPIIVGFMSLFISMRLSFFAQFFYGTLASMALCMLSYQILVRYTWLGNILGSRKSKP